MTKKLASISLDLDNKWAYLKTHGDSAWESYPSYFNLVVPRILNVLDQFDLKITFFVVGQDAAIETNHDALRSIADAGHEIANHSYRHEPWLHLYTPEELEREFDNAESAIEKVTGQRPVGFRGPGFSLSDQTLKLLLQRGYQYDCSTFPTFLGPVARAYYFMRSRLSKEQRKDRKALFGRFSDGFQSNSPYLWTTEEGTLVEIPVTTFPVFKVPIHLSYLVYLSKFSRLLAKTYFSMAIRTSKMLGVSPSLLLHPTDFLGVEDEKDMPFFPGMDLPSERKLDVVKNALITLGKHYECVTMKTHADQALARKLRTRSVETAVPGATSNVVAAAS